MQLSTFKYNGGTLDLTQYLNVHYTQADIKAAADDAEHQIMAYADVADYGLHFEYEMLGYKTGANNTEENKYGTVNNNGIFTPCYVNAMVILLHVARTKMVFLL